MATSCDGGHTPGRFCYGDGVCVEPDGQLVLDDGRPLDGVTQGDDSGGDSAFDLNLGDASCTCDKTAQDGDGDCIEDSRESNSNPAKWDTDDDEIGDGCEDRNRNGKVDAGELDPSKGDTDGDGIADGLEDRNHNGKRDIDETSGLTSDSDGDGVADGVEDANHNGIVDPFDDANGNDCWDPGEAAGETDPAHLDTDGDQLPDSMEATACDGTKTCAWLIDTDCDGLSDGSEDSNHNGSIDFGETDPLDADTDGDGLKDGVEDANGNGFWDLGDETHPLKQDTDGDGIPDGTEDADGDGEVKAYEDTNENGCWDAGEPVGESDPRKLDSDGDGIYDHLEDRSKDGTCDIDLVDDPGGSGGQVAVYLEVCAWNPDTDCDGLADGLEDSNRNGSRDLGELDPKNPDTDADGLYDGCPPFVTDQTWLCEDKNNDGHLDPEETDALLADTDADRLLDGCERTFAGCSAADCGTDPLNEDSDLDGFADGEEDADHDCTVGADETDPTVYDEPPGGSQNCTDTSAGCDTSEEGAKWLVCGTQNLKKLTFAESARAYQDYRLAFEVERDPSSGSEGDYIVHAFGTDSNGDGDVTDPDDAPVGHVFQSPPGVILDIDSGQAINRDIYGFALAGEDDRPLDDILDAIQADLEAAYPTVEVKGGESERPAHDDYVNSTGDAIFRINRAQRIFRVALSGSEIRLGIKVRNDIMINQFLGGNVPAPGGVPPTQDVVYPTGCTGSGKACYGAFRVHVGVVQRRDQGGLTGKPVRVTVVALTPDEESHSDATVRALYADREARLQDLTGGSALGRFNARRGKTCEERPRQMAQADMLWVVDDSGSMQAMVERLQKASVDAKTVLTANRDIVDFRVALTTTNASRVARAWCPRGCKGDCTGGRCVTCAEAHLGCVYMCPSECTTGCAGGECTENDVDDDPGCGGKGTENQCDIVNDDGTSTGCTWDAGAGGSCEYCPDVVTETLCNDGMNCLWNADTTQCEVGTCLSSCIDSSDPAALRTTFDTEISSHPMPGGGGTFYFEDNTLLDCSASTSHIQWCGGTDYSPTFDPFYAGTPGQSAADRAIQLVEHAGFIDANPTANCEATLTQEMDINATVGTGDATCERLTAPCTDGPTVLASQMCDLIRAMGGLKPPMGTSSGGRRHSAPEMGTRSARRLLQRALPALPQNFSSTPSNPSNACSDIADCELSKGERCLDGVCADPHPAQQLRLDCTAPSTGCEPCDPRSDTDCRSQLIPLLTIFLSDEEDYWFKDECAVTRTLEGVQLSPADGDFREYPDTCYYLDGDPTTAEVCTYDYCSASTWTPAGASDPARTRPFRTAPVSGYDPDQAMWANDTAHSLKWRPDCAAISDAGICGGTDGCAWFTIPQNSGPDLDVCLDEGRACSPYDEDADVACLPEPCMHIRDATACENEFGTMCIWGTDAENKGQFCHNYCERYTNCWLIADEGECTAAEDRSCTWDAGQCKQATSYNALATTRQHAACDADLACRWDKGLVTEGDSWRACVPVTPYNDCQACKRFLRTWDAANGTMASGDELILSLVGFEQLDSKRGGRAGNAPVYAIVRERGKEGEGDPRSGESLGVDKCAGGKVTWGRGDGQSYRDLSRLTLGRSHDVCESSTYEDFIRIIIRDIVSLSSPYPLSNAPISATIKVGIARPEPAAGAGCVDHASQSTCTGDSLCLWDTQVEKCRASGVKYFEVPRSTTAGFVYDPTRNSVGFITDDKDADHVPKQGDTIFISYRYWKPVPCRDECQDDEVCAQQVCMSEATLPNCPGGQDFECDVGYICDNLQCKINCTPGEIVDYCKPPTECPACYVFDRMANDGRGECVWAFDPAPVDDACTCNTDESATLCDPLEPEFSCGLGFACSEECSCVEIGGCGGVFNADGTLAAGTTCQEAIDCCSRDNTQASATCVAQPDQDKCELAPGCLWNLEANSNAGACEFPGCCAKTEEPACFEDPEDKTKALYCESQCGCAGVTGCVADPSVCGNFESCYTTDASDTVGVCVCTPLVAYCDISTCQCRQSPL